VRIELNFGGLPFCPMPEFSWNLNDLLKKSEKVVSAFQKVKNQTHNINGGVGVLYPAVDLLETRIRQEEENINNLQTTQKKADEFIQLARSVDSQVASLVDQNKQEFYNDNPWSRPPDPPKEKSRCEQVFEWICGRYEEIKEGIHDIYEGLKGIVSGVGKIIDAHIHIIADVGNYIKDTAIKALDNINKWCVEHKDIVKIENRELSQDEVDKLVLLAPNATINIIRDYEITRKAQLELKDEISGVINCSNPNCISNSNEPIETRFYVQSKEPVVLRCHYCERTMNLDDIDEQF
jgi:aspartate carbamoyltransferase regulatory subunit